MPGTILGGLGAGFEAADDCPRCFTQGSLKAEANRAGRIGVFVVCSKCKKEWSGGWNSVERTRQAMSTPGYFENQLHTELKELIKLSKASVFDQVIEAVEASHAMHTENLATLNAEENPNLRAIVKVKGSINTLDGMLSWLKEQKEIL